MLSLQPCVCLCCAVCDRSRTLCGGVAVTHWLPHTLPSTEVVLQSLSPGCGCSQLWGQAAPHLPNQTPFVAPLGPRTHETQCSGWDKLSGTVSLTGPGTARLCLLLLCSAEQTPGHVPWSEKIQGNCLPWVASPGSWELLGQGWFCWSKPEGSGGCQPPQYMWMHGLVLVH